MTNMTLPEIYRRIHHLRREALEGSHEAKEEVDFYLSVFQSFHNSLNTKANMTMEEISLKVCPLKKAQTLATSLGLNISEGGSGTLYLSWSEGLPKD